MFIKVGAKKTFNVSFLQKKQEILFQENANVLNVFPKFLEGRPGQTVSIVCNDENDPHYLCLLLEIGLDIAENER